MNEDRNAITDLDPCPADEILGLYAEGRVRDPLIAGAIEAHLAFCGTCRRIISEPQGLSSVTEEMITSLAQKLRDRQDHRKMLAAKGTVPGSLWRTEPDPRDELPGPMVLILDWFEDHARESLRVAEVSEDIDQALDTDFLLDPQESGLPFSCMIRSGNIVQTFPPMLHTPISLLPPLLHRRIVEFCNARDRFDNNVPLSEYLFFKDSKGQTFMQRRGVISGMPATSANDPRLPLQEESRRRFYYLQGMAEMRLVGLEVGPLPDGDKDDETEVSDEEPDGDNS